MLPYLSFKRIVRVGARIPRQIGESPFLNFFVFLFFAFLISSGVFWRYAFMLRDATGESQITETHFDQQAFDEVVQLWQEHHKNFREAESLQLRNIFVPFMQESLTE